MSKDLPNITVIGFCEGEVVCNNYNILHTDPASGLGSHYSLVIRCISDQMVGEWR